MTPKEFKFTVALMEHTALIFYKKGADDVKSGKSLNDKQFKASNGTHLKIKKLLSDFLKNS